MGKRYRNKFEEKIGSMLTNLGVNFDYETERLPYTIEAYYIPDFILLTKGGGKIYIETKGNGRSFDGPSRRKLVAVKNQHPELDIRIVFYSDGKIGPTRKDGTRMTQSEWATRHGFKYAIKEIPGEWLAE